MRIFITGGSGFFGKNIVSAFHQTEKVFAPTHKELDILDQRAVEQFIKKNSIDQIIHCATAVGNNYFEPTIMMFRNIVSVAPLVKKVIYFGSGAEYDKQRDLIKIKEDSFGKFIPRDPNGLSKYINSVLSTSAENIFILRVFGVYGFFEDYRKKFISNAIVKHILGMPITIKQNAVFDYLFIEDLITITKYVLSCDVTEHMINCTPDSSISLTDIAALINKISGVNLPVRTLHKDMNFQYTGDNTRLHSVIPEITFQSYEQGIQKMYSYYKKHIQDLDVDSVKADAYLANAIVKK